MTTMNVNVRYPSATPRRTMLDAVRDARLWVRDTPAPRWEGDAGAKVTFAGYVGGSIVLWTLLGLTGSAILGLLLKAIA